MKCTLLYTISQFRNGRPAAYGESMAEPLQRRFIKGATRDSKLISVSHSVGAVPRGLVGPVGHETKKTIDGSGRSSEGHPTGREEALALQLCFLWISESMGNHDSNVVGTGRIC
jgi:hypothetical protein